MNSIYKCEKYGQLLEVVQADGQFPECCGEAMVKLEENTVDAALEKHVPVVERTPDGVLVKVGAVPHPMEEAHYIMWIEIYYGDNIQRKYLHPGDKPEASFKVTDEEVTARIYCNLHGLWKSA